ncbi:hypothetical protein [Bacillus xiapuensis]|uniref:Post-SET domain-containing protein n=1 Tax=Bacillus xiapuensis TaxID=2014075 RepID=A0ABU6N806_9BACI|nr:hypothetical protein [Bacillus xiapuensis]
MTKEEFEEKYCKESGITKQEYDKYEVTLPCNCDYEGCEGWAAVTNTQYHIRAHMELYGNIK